MHIYRYVPTCYWKGPDAHFLRCRCRLAIQKSSLFRAQPFDTDALPSLSPRGWITLYVTHSREEATPTLGICLKILPRTKFQIIEDSTRRVSLLAHTCRRKTKLLNEGDDIIMYEWVSCFLASFPSVDFLTNLDSSWRKIFIRHDI